MDEAGASGAASAGEGQGPVLAVRARKQRKFRRKISDVDDAADAEWTSAYD